MTSRGKAALLALTVFTFATAQSTTVRAQVAVDPTESKATQILDLGLTLTGAYDTDEAPELLNPGFAEFQPAGYSTWAIGSLQYIRRFSAGELQTAVASTFRYYTAVEDVTSVSHRGALTLATALPGRMSLRVEEVAAYSPSYLYSLFPSLPSGANAPVPVTSDFNFDVDTSSSYTSDTTLDLSRQIGQRTRVSILGTYNYSDFSSELLTQNRLTVYSVGSRVARNTSRNTILSAEYRYRTGEYGYAVGVTTGEHVVQLGLDVNRRVSATRQANFFIRAGGSSVEIPESLAQFDVGDRQYQVNGEVGAIYPLRLGQLRGSFTRSLQFVAGLTEPVFVNGFSGEFNGIVARRVGILGRFSKSAGQSLLTTDNLLDTYAGQARADIQLTRRLFAFTEYVYYMYDTRAEGEATPNVPVAPGIPSTLKRHGVRAGLLFQVPVLRR